MIVDVLCNQCGASLAVPLVTGAPWPNISTICQKCEEGMMCVSDMPLAETDTTPPHSAFATHQVPTIELEPRMGEPSGTFSGFLNRISPSIIAGEIIAERGEEGILHDELVEEFLRRSDRISSATEKFERRKGISRGQRISDGFPSEGSTDSSVLITLKSTIGSNRKAWSSVSGIGNGFLRDTNLLEVVPLDDGFDLEGIYSIGSRVRVRDSDHPLFNIDRAVGAGLYGRLMEANNDWDFPFVTDSTDPPGIPMPQYLEDDIVRLLLKHIEETSPQEYEWLREIVLMITNSPPEGWDSNNYAPVVTQKLFTDEDFTPCRWNDFAGRSLTDMYRIKGMERAQGKRLPLDQVEDFAMERMEAHINAKLGGALGRLKEMGIIYPVKSGRRKNFRPTRRAGWLQ